MDDVIRIGASAGAAIGVWSGGVGEVPRALIGGGSGVIGGFIGGYYGSEWAVQVVNHYHGR
ncbi:Uncharacterised protein [Sphingobacterium spiritivorum]|uniref:Uncharacterized protein n=1 Tax=Sphingobacterium spiritivorum ATCC 33861 TaxID=525373 RepID=D7VTZ0_SPHSI|nr:hypothetical protein HMPREF0766_14460 [Sphingobacterium spiritivorum ATCC 33861]SUI98677.1 Uncharacterised protein [Sphingobacterium spiritivorum]